MGKGQLQITELLVIVDEKVVGIIGFRNLNDGIVLGFNGGKQRFGFKVVEPVLKNALIVVLNYVFHSYILSQLAKMSTFEKTKNDIFSKIFGYGIMDIKGVF